MKFPEIGKVRGDGFGVFVGTEKRALIPVVLTRREVARAVGCQECSTDAIEVAGATMRSFLAGGDLR